MNGESFWNALIFARTWIIDFLYILAGLIALYLLQARFSFGLEFSSYLAGFGRIEEDIVLVFLAYGLGRVLKTLVDMYVLSLTVLLLWDKRIERIGSWFKDLSHSVNDQYLPVPDGKTRSVFEMMKVIEDHDAVKKEFQKMSEGDSFMRMFIGLFILGLFINWDICLPMLLLFTVLVLGNNVHRYRFYQAVDQFARSIETK